MDATQRATSDATKSTASGPQRPPRTPFWRRLSTWLVVYGVALALIAFWPQPVDSGAGRLLRWITAHFPLLTYSRFEFGANILLFVPLGAGLALLLPRMRHLVMPVALLTTVTIESVQAVLISARTPSVYDIIANVSGAAFGLVAVAVIESWRRRHPHRASAK